MKYSEIIIGEKYIPISKTFGELPLHHVYIWKQALDSNRPYLFCTSKQDGLVHLAYNESSAGYVSFRPQDLKKY